MGVTGCGLDSLWVGDGELLYQVGGVPLIVIKMLVEVICAQTSSQVDYEENRGT